ncbi:hypothetical protein ACWGOE_07240 [Leucobacter chromiiresistens]
MAIVWGSYQNHVRLGIDVIMSPSSVGISTSSVTLTVRTYAQMDGSSSIYYNGLSLSFSGSWSGGASVNVNLGPGQSALIHSATFTRSTSSSSQAQTFGATLSHVHGSTSTSRGFTIPARPAAPPPRPNAPSNLSAVRNSDSQVTLTWSRNSTYTSVIVQRSAGNGTWSQVGRPSGNAFTFVDRTVKPNERYYYRVFGVNAGGTSPASGTAGPVYTTPRIPSRITATRVTAGIRVNAEEGGRPPYAASYDVMDGSTQIASAVALPWTHANPTPTSHVYKVRARIGSLVSGWSVASNVVAIAAPPKAPTNLSPNGQVVSTLAVMVLSWRHNPVDASEQTARQLQWRRAGDAAWTVLPAVSTDSETALMLSAEATFGVGDIEWQVRTKGQHADYSPWSATATFTLTSPPSVSVTSPVDPWDQARAVVAWDYSQDLGRPQSSWEAELYDGNDLLVARRSGTGSAGSLTFPDMLTDDTTYTARVRAATGTLWSDWDSFTFTVSFVPPAIPSISGEWSEDTGAVTLSVGAGDPQPGGAPVAETGTIDLLRSVDNGQVWEPVLIDSPDVNLIVDDAEALSNGQTMYRAIAYASGTGASAFADISVLADSPAPWLSGGEQFGIAARLPYSPEVNIESGRERSVQRYEGRARGVAYAGEQLSRVVKASGSVIGFDDENASVELLEEVARAPEPLHLYRDPDGRRIYGVLSTITLPRQAGAAGGDVWGWSFQLEETDRD